jgi:tetratricopeptide (TPR) repeat protein
VATVGAAGDAAAARARCKQAVGGRRQKELLSVCSDAFAADPTAADVAVILAKAEFDKGHAAQAMAWSQKALAADPNAADAYVFIGGVEQSAGRKKAAKEAYKRYLQLAPGGRYAGDLRAIVGSL